MESVAKYDVFGKKILALVYANDVTLIQSKRRLLNAAEDTAKSLED